MYSTGQDVYFKMLTSIIFNYLQVVWLSLFFEILQEMLILPLYFTIGNSISDLSVTSNKIKTGSLIVTLIFSVSATILYFFMPQLVTLMGNKDLLDKTVDYVRYGEIFFINPPQYSFL